MDPIRENAQVETRRSFFGRAGAMSLGTVALADLLAREGIAFPGADPASPALPNGAGGLPGLPHFAPKAKRAIYLHMNGGPSQIDLFDYKPKMDEQFDKDLPDSIRKGQRLTTMTSGQSRFPVAPSRYKFAQHGKSGMWISELLPWTAKIVDEIALVKTTWTEAINHDPAVTYICTGNQIPGRASLGSWLSYGLGAMNQDLPAFVVMTPSWSSKTSAQAIYTRLWSAGFLPSKHQGVALRSVGDPVLFLSNPSGVDRSVRRRTLDAINRLNQKEYDSFADPETQARIAQYEMAFRMQTSVPELADISNEPKNILDMYGPDVHKPGTFARSALLARRLAERDVRFVQIFHRGWDQHGNLAGDLPAQCKDVDQATYALITDLKQRGLLDDTLVIWGGEFGRTIYCQGPLSRENYGRDHHPKCFPVWFAGGGIKKGVVHGETDDFSYNVVQDPVHIHDMNATILHCMGIDHRRLSFKSQGLDMRLTGVLDQNPVQAILA
ncbi:DUF1501 domain-containing protein [Paludisphaera mucosa]|uniref:DUF1501 domain-containing protein n=1 Tax=Paludisphaera mucosa TaxID=3030827 RepID=A0ABT6FK36_9BACT|nr:DUF1501 domain-containing protein [Paludisphaera mucosa]MDG3007943.1 DUF1501 domain-containing protein [Paludisphaera mucosa]